MVRKLMAAAAALVLGAGFALAGDVKSGPQAGEKVPGPFHPFNVTGEDAGKEACLYCRNGDNPVAVVFARTPSDPTVQKLIKALDEATAKNAKCEMGSYVVYLTGNKDKVEAELKAQASKLQLKQIVLSIESPEGPNKYNIAKDADVTVLLYANRTVKANHAFEKAKLTDKDVEKITADVSKILPTK